MLDGSEELGFVLEARAPLRTRHEVTGKDFERDVALETGVASSSDLSLSTGPEHTDNFVRTQALPGTEAHEGRE